MLLRVNLLGRAVIAPGLLPDPGEAQQHGQGLIAAGLEGTLCKGADFCCQPWEESSSVPVKPPASHSTGPSELPGPAGVIGSLCASSQLLDFLQLFHFLPEALMADRVTPFSADAELTMSCPAPLTPPGWCHC